MPYKRFLGCEKGEDGTPKIVESEAEIVRLIYCLFMEGKALDLNTAIMTPLVRLILRHPKFMESKVFLKAMLIFHEKISRSYDSKVMSSDADFQAVLSYGLRLLHHKPLKILDLFVGTEFGAFMALEIFPDAFVTGVDQSVTKIEFARKKVDLKDADRVEFDFGNATRLDHED